MSSFPSITTASAFSLLLLLSLVACSGEPPPSTPPTTPSSDAAEQAAVDAPVPDHHTSQLALDWAGRYSGVLPCASCPGIETTVTLGQDGSFERRMVYIDESPMPVVETGSFTWDEAGRSITATGDGFEPQRYQVGEHRLFHLDRDGQRIEGDLAANYVLDQHIQDPRLEDRHWTLIELRGQAVEPGEDRREAFLFLRAEDGRAHGNASCNSFNGAYAIKTGQRIGFDRNFAMTMMACPNMQLEQGFIEVLQTVDNYSLGDDGTMTLNRARMAPLARFVESAAAEE